MSRSVHFVLAASFAIGLVACGSGQSSSPPPSVPPSSTAPTAYGGGPRDDWRLTPSPYDSVGGMNDDDMNSEPSTGGTSPSFEQPDAKANSTVKQNKPAPNGERR